MANIHTLADLNTDTVMPIPPTPTQLPFVKSKAFKKSMLFWTEVMRANEDLGVIIPVPLKVGTKRPADGIRFAVSHAQSDRWNNAKLQSWIKKKKFHKTDVDLGVLYEGGIAVLDFDCSKDYDWFIDNFNVNPNDYIVMRNVSKHNCSCETTEEFTYQLFFRKDDFFGEKTNACPCIFDPSGERLMNIDYLRDSLEGTPHVSKVFVEGSERKLIYCPADKVIKQLSPIISHYFKGKWKKTKREIIKGSRNMKYVELVESIDVVDITSNNMTCIIRELIGVGIDPEVIINMTIDIRSKSPYNNRIGAGPTKEYTDEEHLRWVQNIIDTNTIDGQRRTGTITSLARKDVGKFTTIEAKWLDQFGTEFCVSYLHDLKFNIQDEGERGKKVLAYYNHFFIMTAGMKKNAIWFRKYNTQGHIIDIGEFQDKGSFLEYAGIEMICYPNGKAVNTAKWWFKEKRITYDKVIFQPYGLKRSNKITIPPNVFNTFQGYNMKYIPNYKKTEFDSYGDLINNHIRNVLCWNGKGEDECNEELYAFYRGWIHKVVVLGERTHVALVHYSKGMGTGKSLFSSGLMTHVFGEHVCMLNSCFNKMIKDQFTDYWDTNVLTTLEEMPETSSDKDIKAGWDFIKALITEDKMTSRKFMTAPDKMDLHTNLIINTNHFYSIPPFIPVRRSQVNRVSPHKIGDNDYFTPLIRAIDSFEGWENFIHRYIIKDYHQFSHIQVQPNESFMIETQYRKELMARGNDAVIYFFKELLDALAKGEEEPYAGVMGKTLTLSGLFERYKLYKMENNIEFDSCKNVSDFEKKIMTKFEINIRALVKRGKPVKLEEGLSDIATPKVVKTRMGKGIVIDEHFIKQVQDVVKHKTLNEEDALLIDEDEEEQMLIDLDELMPYQEHNFLD